MRFKNKSFFREQNPNPSFFEKIDASADSKNYRICKPNLFTRMFDLIALIGLRI